MDEQQGNAKTETTEVTPRGALPRPSLPMRMQRPNLPPRPTEHQKTKFFNNVFLVLAAGVIGFGGGWLGGQQANDSQDITTSHAAQRVVLDKQGQLISDIANEVGQSVVSVNVTSQSQAQPFDFFGMGGGGSQTQQSAGTGIIISSDGLIITNRHVVPAGSTSVNVVLSNGTTLDNVEVVGRTNENDPLDIAFLRIKDAKGQKLVAAKLGKSSEMKVGQSVIAIGNALGQFQNTVTTGIISGFGRSVTASDSGGSSSESLDDLFQTDAAINPGNSGGPLVNLNGEVIGINTAVADQAQNIGFAIPIDNISGLIKGVSETGKLQRPYIGVVYIPITDAVAKQYNLPVKRGAYIPTSSEYGQDTVVDGGPADKAGIKEGDIIVKVNGTSLSDSAGLPSLLGKYSPGDKVTLTVNRGGHEQDIDVTLGIMPSSNS